MDGSEWPVRVGNQLEKWRRRDIMELEARVEDWETGSEGLDWRSVSNGGVESGKTDIFTDIRMLQSRDQIWGWVGMELGRGSRALQGDIKSTMEKTK